MDNQINKKQTKVLISKCLLKYFDGEFVFLNKERFLVEVEGESIFLISTISGIKNIESLLGEEFYIDSNYINSFLSSWFSKNQLLKIIPKRYELCDYNKFWLTEKFYLDQERLIREVEKSSLVVNLTDDRNQSAVRYHPGRESYMMSILSAYMFDMPSKEEVEMFENYENR